MAQQSGGGTGGKGRADPDIPFSFFVEIDGIRCVKFREASGLEWKADPESFNEGGNNAGQVHLVGRGSFTPLKLKKGFFAASGEFYDWMKSLMDGGSTAIKRATVSVVVQNEAGDELGRFDLFGAFMTRYVGPGFNAMDGSVAFEEVEIVYDRFEYKPAK
jgi:phage tail-like protein